MISPKLFHPSPILSTVLATALFSLAASQAWDYTYREYVEEEVPIFTIIKDTLSNGYYNHGNGMTMKSVIFELGGCSKGHPCAISTGLSHLYPDGCPTTCVDRWADDPFRTYDQQCADTITAGNSAFLEQHHGNLTQLVTEWFEYFDTSCMLNNDFFADEWIHEAEGVAVVTRAQGFTFPAQTVIISDIDSTNVSQTSAWPDVVQEVSTNFAMLGDRLLRPTNLYAADRHSFLEVLESGEYVTEINVTLSQTLLDTLQLPANSTWMPATMSALTSDKVGMLPSWIYPEFAKQVMGGMVWARFSSPFDSKYYSSHHSSTFAKSTIEPMLTIFITPYSLHPSLHAHAHTRSARPDHDARTQTIQRP